MKAKEPKIKTYTLEQIKDEMIGRRGTAKRDEYEFELTLELLGKMIKTTRKQRHLTQAQLGKLVGVQKAQISKLEKNATNVTIGTILRIFDALKAKVNMRIELENKRISAA